MEDVDVRLRFGHGLNTTGAPDEIGQMECQDGQNFDLEAGRSSFLRRRPFDLAGTATNGEEVRGFAQVQRSDGTTHTAIQAGGTVYDWDGANSFSSVGSVSSGSRIRGGRAANFQLNEQVIVTDIERQTPVKTWDGTNFQTMATGLGSDFKAKYCVVDNERALFGNVSAAGDTPHLLVGSERGDNTVLTITDRPSSSLSEADPFFIPVQDLRAINGLTQGFGRVVFSTEEGATWKLTGSSAKNFEIDPLHPESAVVGDEGLVNIGNDITIPRAGKVDTLFGTESFGDVEVDDLTRMIKNLVKDIDSWSVAFDPRLQRVYCLPKGGEEVFVLHKSIFDFATGRVSRLQQKSVESAWSRWTTQHSFGFRTAAMWTMKRPGTNLDYVYMGGPSGEIFQMEGDGDQDGGSANVKAERVSPLLTAPPGEFFDISGEVLYRKSTAETLTITLEQAGRTVADSEVTLSLQGPDANYFGEAKYFGGSNYFGIKFRNRRVRSPITIPGQSDEIQIRLSVDGAADFFIDEVNLTIAKSK